MIERIHGLPDNVLGFRARGEVTGTDYERVLIPAVEEALVTHRKIRLLYHLDEDFTGFDAKAMWDDAKVGLQHLTAWERIAMVTDITWLRGMVTALGFILPAQVRLFRNSELEIALKWINE
jgi:hypothetical protein